METVQKAAKRLSNAVEKLERVINTHPLPSATTTPLSPHMVERLNAVESALDDTIAALEPMMSTGTKG